MIEVDFIFGATFPCCFCGEQTAYGISLNGNWVSICKPCSLKDEVNSNDILF